MVANYFVGGSGRLRLAVILSSLGWAATAQTYSGTFAIVPQCGTSVTGSLPPGPALDGQVGTGACNFLCGVPPFAGVGSNNEARWSRFVDRGIIVLSCDSAGTQLTAAPCGSTAGGLSNLSQNISANDVLFTDIANPGSTGPIVNFTMRVDFRGQASQTGPVCVFANSIVHLCAGNGSCLVDGTLNGVTGQPTGALVGYPNDGSLTTLTTSQFSGQLNIPMTIQLDLSLNASGVLCESSTPSSILTLSTAMLSLPHSGVVFNLPPGITCNSVQLGIVNNQWTAAGAASVTPFGTGCAGGNGQPLVLSAVGLPLIGNTGFALTLTGPPDTTSAVVFLATSAVLNAPPLVGSCSILLDIPSALTFIAAGVSPLGPATVTGGAAVFPLPVPLLPVAVGFTLGVQAVAFDASAPGGLTLSNALTLVAGT